MSKKKFVLFISLNAVVLAFLLLSMENISSLNFREGSNVVLHEELMTEQRRVESEYLRYMQNLKKTVVSNFLSKDVQKLRRASLRKKYFHGRKSDRLQETLRFAIYTAKKKGSRLTVRPVYETHKSKIFWDKLINMVAKQAFVLTNETSASLNVGNGEKLNEIISIFLKDAGLSNIEKPGNFNEFAMLGEDALLYWDIIYKKCSASIRRTTGSTQCVKGIFIGEIDRRNSVKDFALHWQSKTDQNSKLVTEFGQLKSVMDQSFIEAYWPLEQNSNKILGENLSKSIDDSGSRFFKQESHLNLISKSEVLPHTILVSKISTEKGLHLPFLKIAIVLLVLMIPTYFYYIPRS